LPTLIFLLTLKVLRKRKYAHRSFSWIWEHNNKTVY